MKRSPVIKPTVHTALMSENVSTQNWSHHLRDGKQMHMSPDKIHDRLKHPKKIAHDQSKANIRVVNFKGASSPTRPTKPLVSTSTDITNLAYAINDHHISDGKKSSHKNTYPTNYSRKTSMKGGQWINNEPKTINVRKKVKIFDHDKSRAGRTTRRKNVSKSCRRNVSHLDETDSKDWKPVIHHGPADFVLTETSEGLYHCISPLNDDKTKSNTNQNQNQKQNQNQNNKSNKSTVFSSIHKHPSEQRIRGTRKHFQQTKKKQNIEKTRIKQTSHYVRLQNESNIFHLNDRPSTASVVKTSNYNKSNNERPSTANSRFTKYSSRGKFNSSQIKNLLQHD